MERRGRVELALMRALRAVPVERADAAAVELARRYAAAIDAQDVEPLSKLGRGLTDVLIELGLTPKARAAILKDAPQKNPVSVGLDELRARRERKA